MRSLKIGSFVRARNLATAGFSVLVLAALAGSPLATLGNIAIPSSNESQLHGGEILPPSAKPRGFSLSDMAAENALFVTSGNTNSQVFPTTPFQILYADPTTIRLLSMQGGVLETGSNSFSLPAGTMFYVPIANVDDSPPVLGPFPTSRNTVSSYWFDSSQLGGSDFITVDGHTTSIGATFLVGPITTQLSDGGGTHIITMGVFLTPFNKGAHKVSINTQFDGALFPQDLGINFFDGEFTFEVTVQ